MLSNSSSFLLTTPLSTSILASNKVAEYIPPILSLPSTARLRLSLFRESNASAIEIETKGSNNVTAASLDFIRLPACTESWLSRLAASNGTVMTTITDILTLSLSSNSTTAHVPGGSAGIDVIGPTTQIFTMGTRTFRLNDDAVCCGTCNILYPNVLVYYWPVLKNNNTWCLRYLKNSTSPASPTISLNAPTSASPGPTLLPDTSLLGSMVNEQAPSFPKLTSKYLDPNSGPQLALERICRHELYRYLPLCPRPLPPKRHQTLYKPVLSCHLTSRGSLRLLMDPLCKFPWLDPPPVG